MTVPASPILPTAVPLAPTPAPVTSRSTPWSAWLRPWRLAAGFRDLLVALACGGAAAALAAGGEGVAGPARSRPPVTPAPDEAPMSALRQLCNVGRPHVEVRACMVAKSRESSQAVDRRELALRAEIESRAASAPHLRHALPLAEGAAKAYTRLRLQRCELEAALVTGQAAQREQRLSCTHELNQQRLQEIERLQARLP